MSKILVGYIEDLKHSGIDKYLLNVLTVANENNVQMDFLSSNFSLEAAEYLKQFGSTVYKINNLKKPFEHYKDVKRILKSGGYDKAYFNISEPLNMMGAKAAHDLKIKCAVHSHNSGMGIQNNIKRFIRGVINTVCRPMLCAFTDEFLACSKKAAIWLFGKRKQNGVTIIYNAVDTSRFKLDSEKRQSIRQTLGIDDNTLVIGHIGNYIYAKNNFFLADILKETIKLNSDTQMLLIGDGEDRPAVINKFEELKLQNNIKYLGIRSDVADLLCAMDVFVLPSRIEGLPIVAIEAQLSGIACVLSSNIDSMVAVGKNCVLTDINSAKKWAEKIMQVARKGQEEYNSELLKNYSFENNKQQIKEIILKV